MKKTRKLLAVVAAVLLLAVVFLLVAPLPLTWWLPQAEVENAVWQCAIKVYDERPVAELTAEETQPFAEMLEQAKVRFCGWTDDAASFPYAQVFWCDSKSDVRVSDVGTLSMDEQGLLLVDGVRFEIAEDDKAAFIEAFGQACDAALAQKFKES